MCITALIVFPEVLKLTSFNSKYKGHKEEICDKRQGEEEICDKRQGKKRFFMSNLIKSSSQHQYK